MSFQKSWDIGDILRIPSFLIASTDFIDNQKEKILLKLSGDCVEDAGIIEGIGRLAGKYFVTIVHGAGSQINYALDEMGIDYEYDDFGRRITTEEEAGIIEEIVGDIGRGLEEDLNGYPGKSRFDVYDYRNTHAEWIDPGLKGSNFTGKVLSMDVTHLDYKIVPCLGVIKDSDTVLNINADDVASYIVQNSGMDEICLVTKSAGSPGRGLKDELVESYNAEIVEIGDFGEYVGGLFEQETRNQTGMRDLQEW